ncbi:hypothetical protein TWF281_008457 [Arthrobotrys megalospora]
MELVGSGHATFTSIPNELISKIVAYLVPGIVQKPEHEPSRVQRFQDARDADISAQRDLRALSLTCKRLRGFLLPFVFDRFGFDVSGGLTPMLAGLRLPGDGSVTQEQLDRFSRTDNAHCLESIIAMNYHTMFRSFDISFPASGLYFWRRMLAGTDLVPGGTPKTGRSVSVYNDAIKAHLQRHLDLLGPVLEQTTKQGKLKRINILLDGNPRGRVPHQWISRTREETRADTTMLATMAQIMNFLRHSYRKLQLPKPDQYNGELVLSCCNNVDLREVDFDSCLNGIIKLVTRLRINERTEGHPQYTNARWQSFLGLLMRSIERSGRLRELIISTPIPPQKESGDPFNCRFPRLQQLHLCSVAIKLESILAFFEFHRGIVKLSLQNISFSHEPAPRGSWNKILTTIHNALEQLVSFSFYSKRMPWGMESNITDDGITQVYFRDQMKKDCRTMCDLQHDVAYRRALKAAREERPEPCGEHLSKKVAALLEADPSFNWVPKDQRKYSNECQMFTPDRPQDWYRQKSSGIDNVWGDGLVNGVFDFMIPDHH